MLRHACEVFLIIRETFNAPLLNDINVPSRLLYFILLEVVTKTNPTKPSFYDVGTRTWETIVLGSPTRPTKKAC